MFLLLLPPHNNTHDCSHVPQIEFKTHIDKNRSRRSIFLHQQKCAYCINMHHNYEKNRFFCLWLSFGTMPALAEYTTISEAAIYLVIDPLMYKSWEEKYL